MSTPTFQEPSTDSFFNMFGPDLEQNSNEIPLTFTLYGYSLEKGRYVEESHEALIQGDEDTLKLSSLQEVSINNSNFENQEFDRDNKA